MLIFLLPLKVQTIGLPLAYSGMLLSTFGLSAIFVFVLPINRIFNGADREKVICYGMFIISLSLLGLSIFLNLSLLFICLAIYGIGFAFMFPSINALILDHCEKNNRGKGFGIFYAFFSFGVVAGSFVTGFLNLEIDTGFRFGSTLMLTFLVILIFRSKMMTKGIIE
ncbi:MAG: MFS transporter [Bacillaceae bacterium]|nr:MFS transporter [Bacillaceae bacterium]